MIGKGCIISPNTRIRYPDSLNIGDHCIIDDFVYISCALTMGDYSHISANCTLLGGNVPVAIGSFVDIGPGCCVASASQGYSSGGLSGPCIPERFRGDSIKMPVRLGDFALFGCNTVVLPGVHVPEGVSTGAFTLLDDQEYEPWTLYVGIPARPLKRRKVISADHFISSLL